MRASAAQRWGGKTGLKECRPAKEAKALATRYNVVRRTQPSIFMRTLLTMLDIHITLLETCHFSRTTLQMYDGICFVFVLATGPLTLIGLCNTTLLKGQLHASTFVVCWRKCLIEIKTFFQQKMLNKRHQTCMLHVLTLLIQQMLYNKCSTLFLLR